MGSHMYVYWHSKPCWYLVKYKHKNLLDLFPAILLRKINLLKHNFSIKKKNPKINDSVQNVKFINKKAYSYQNPINHCHKKQFFQLQPTFAT